MDTPHITYPWISTRCVLTVKNNAAVCYMKSLYLIKNKFRLWLKPKWEKKECCCENFEWMCFVLVFFFSVLLGIYRNTGSYGILVVFLGTGIVDQCSLRKIPGRHDGTHGDKSLWEEVSQLSARSGSREIELESYKGITFNDRPQWSQSFHILLG